MAYCSLLVFYNNNPQKDELINLCLKTVNGWTLIEKTRIKSPLRNVF